MRFVPLTPTPSPSARRQLLPWKHSSVYPGLREQVELRDELFSLVSATLLLASSDSVVSDGKLVFPISKDSACMSEGGHCGEEQPL